MLTFCTMRPRIGNSYSWSSAKLLLRRCWQIMRQLNFATEHKILNFHFASKSKLFQSQSPTVVQTVKSAATEQPDAGIRRSTAVRYARHYSTCIPSNKEYHTLPSSYHSFLYYLVVNTSTHINTTLTTC